MSQRSVPGWAGVGMIAQIPFTAGAVINARFFGMDFPSIRSA